MAVTNLFTNPRLKGDGTWTEVRRNYSKSPNPPETHSSSNWTASSVFGNTGSFETDAEGPWFRAVAPDNLASGSGFVYAGNSAGFRATVTAGVETTFSLEGMFSALNMAWTLRVTFFDASNVLMTSPTGSFSNATSVGVWERRSITLIPPAGAVSARVDLAVGVRAWAEGDWVGVRRCFVGGTGNYFDGSTTPETAGDVVQPEDFRWRWLGEPNASESVMEIERVRGVLVTNCVAGVSSWNGRPAMRLISLHSSGASTARIVVPEEARSGGTAIGTLHMREPLTGPLSPNSREIRINDPVFRSEKSPNAAGSYEHRVVFTALSSTYQFNLFHGGSFGPDVWWTDIGLFEGEYNGPYGDGSMRGWYWAGEPDNSPSIKAPRPNPDHRRKMYFGVPGAMTWVPCPQIERPSGLSQWQEEVQLLNGGLHVRRSYGGHRVFELTWTGISAEEAQLLEAYASGVYGDGLIYWLDPMMADKNVLPIWWSAPAMGALGAPSLGAGGRVPEVAPNYSAPTEGSPLPREHALFELYPFEQGADLFIPIPENHRLHVSALGLSEGGGVLAVDADPVTLHHPGAASQWAWEYFDPAWGGEGRNLRLRTQSEWGSVTLTAVQAQVLPLGVDPESPRSYTPGMGAAGCVITEFDKTDMSAAFNKVNVTMVLKEVGPWR